MPDTVMMEQFSLTQMIARGQFRPDFGPGVRFSTIPEHLLAHLLTTRPSRNAPAGQSGSGHVPLLVCVRQVALRTPAVPLITWFALRSRKCFNQRAAYRSNDKFN